MATRACRCSWLMAFLVLLILLARVAISAAFLVLPLIAVFPVTLAAIAVVAIGFVVLVAFAVLAVSLFTLALVTLLPISFSLVLRALRLLVLAVAFAAVGLVALAAFTILVAGLVMLATIDFVTVALVVFAVFVASVVLLAGPFSAISRVAVGLIFVGLLVLRSFVFLAFLLRRSLFGVLLGLFRRLSGFGLLLLFLCVRERRSRFYLTTVISRAIARMPFAIAWNIARVINAGSTIRS
ncbi:MAG: hypothetical protein AAFS05_00150 [Pseudomonadota bacterium]